MRGDVVQLMDDDLFEKMKLMLVMLGRSQHTVDIYLRMSTPDPSTTPDNLAAA